jgi:cytochrome c556
VRRDRPNVKKAVDARTPAEAVTDATRLHEAFLLVDAFWKDRNVDDAIKSSAEELSGAAKTAAAAKAGSADDLQAGYNAMQGQCRRCHTAHRERLPDGTSRIK